MSQRGAERNRLSTYEVKAGTYQNDSLPDSDTTSDEAQQKQGIDKSTDQVLAKTFTCDSVNRLVESLVSMCSSLCFTGKVQCCLLRARSLL